MPTVSPANPNNMLKPLALPFLVLTVLTGTALYGAEPSIDEIAPSLKQLGTGWTSNSVVVCVDQVSPTKEICNEGKGWLQAARNVVGKNGCEAYAVIRYHSVSNQFLVWINRFNSKESIRSDWGTDKQTKAKPDKLPQLGEEVRFYQRHGMHNNIAFRRGAYLVDVEGSNAEIEELKTLAELVDNNLLKAQKDHGC